MFMIVALVVVILCCATFIGCCISKVSDWEKKQEDMWQEECCKQAYAHRLERKGKKSGK